MFNLSSSPSTPHLFSRRSRFSPGLGQHYCVECAKHFESGEALKSHWRSKVHKRRCKALREPAYTQEEAEKAAGLGREEKKSVTCGNAPMTVET